MTFHSAATPRQARSFYPVKKPISHHLNGRIAEFLVALALLTIVCDRSFSQSLDPRKPAPLQAGDNAGTVDSVGGTNYFYFWGEPGDSTLTATYKSMGFLGNAMRSEITVELFDENRTWVSRLTLSSANQSGQKTLHGNLKKESKLIVAVIPPPASLVVRGGDYAVSATGAVRFDKPLSTIDLMIGTYTPSVIYNNENTAARFTADGKIEFASGTTGTWKLFDEDARIFTVNFLENHLSLKLLPGRGLVETGNPSTIVFRRNRP